MIKKKSIAALLTVALSISMMGVTSKTVYAGEYSSVSVEIENLINYKQAKDSKGITWGYYKYNDGTICIGGTYDLKSVMEIPSNLDGCTVTGIDSLLGYENAILYKESIIGKPVNKVIIPSGIKIIESGAFARCANLTEIQIPSTVNLIGSAAFNKTWTEANRDSNGFVVVNGILIDGNKASGNVNIPSNIRYIADVAFSDSNDITSVKIPSSVTEMGQGAFQDSSIQSVNISGRIKKIPDRAFEDCTSLTDVKIEDGVETIGNDAFSECKISKINIPDSVTSIEDGAFTNCQNLKEINYNPKVALGGQAFLGTPWLDKQSKTGNFTILNGVLLECDSNASGEVVIPDGVKEIAGSAFSSNMNITSVKIPEGVTKIGSFAFSDCRSFSKVDVPSSVNKIEYGAFDFCNNVTFTGLGAEFAKSEKDSRYGSASVDNSNNQTSQSND